MTFSFFFLMLLTRYSQRCLQLWKLPSISVWNQFCWCTISFCVCVFCLFVSFSKFPKHTKSSSYLRKSVVFQTVNCLFPSHWKEQIQYFINRNSQSHKQNWLTRVRFWKIWVHISIPLEDEYNLGKFHLESDCT